MKLYEIALVLLALTETLQGSNDEYSFCDGEGPCVKQESDQSKSIKATIDAKTKYYRDKILEYHSKHSTDPSSDEDEEDLEKYMAEIDKIVKSVYQDQYLTDDNDENVFSERHSFDDVAKEKVQENTVPGDSVNTMDIAEDLVTEESDGKEEVLQTPSEGEEDVDDDYEFFKFPPLTRIDPGEVGDEIEVELEEGVMYKRITKSKAPPIFILPNFLSDEECDHIINAAAENGLNTSMLFGANLENRETTNLSDMSRISDQTWLYEKNIGTQFWNKLQKRVAKLTELPVGMIQRSEPIQVVSYQPGGHYHAHLDSVDNQVLPCCFQTRCGEKENTNQWGQCCRLCRYITVLYYLNDVEEGGETAFPLADMAEDLYKEKFVNIKEQKWYNLSYHCHNSSLVVKPKRGTAVMWYNHFVDPKTGYLGQADQRSHHGGCDLIKGSKWIANNWISGTTYMSRYSGSVFYP